MRALSVVVCFFLCFLGAYGVMVYPSDANFQYVGRVDKSNATAYSFDWSGTQIFATFKGSTSVTFVFLPPQEKWKIIHFDLFVDGKYISIFNVTATTQKLYPLGINFTTAQHTVNLRKRIEVDYGDVSFGGIMLDDGGSLIPSPPRPNKRIEFIGDSITCGVGVDGLGPCIGGAPAEDNIKTYASIASGIVGADYTSISWSGQGMVRHYGCPNITCSNSSMPSIYNRTLGSSPTPVWDFKSWVPQAVAINLGTNDYGTQPYPPFEVFVQGYVEFVKTQIVPNYGKNVTILASCYYAGQDCECVQAAAGNLSALGYNAYYVSYAPTFPINNFLGCDGHPSYVAHQVWGEYLAPILQKVMGW